MEDGYARVDDKRPRNQGGGSRYTFTLVALLLLLLCVGGLAVAVGVVCSRLEARIGDSERAVSGLQMQAAEHNATIGYLQTVVGMLTLGGNVTLLEQGVCHLWSMEIQPPFYNLVNPVDSGLLVNYSVYSREGGTYAVFSEFPGGAAVPSYAFVRPSIR